MIRSRLCVSGRDISEVRLGSSHCTGLVVHDLNLPQSNLCLILM